MTVKVIPASREGITQEQRSLLSMAVEGGLRLLCGPINLEGLLGEPQGHAIDPSERK